MVRGKIEIKKIDNVASRQVTFTKRRKGLFKKAQDLSVLCDAHVGIIVISSTSKVYDFASNGNMKEVIEEYTKKDDEGKVINSSSEAKLWKLEAESLRLKLEDLSKQYRLWRGEGLMNLNMEQIENLEKQMDAGITALRARKAALRSKEKAEAGKAMQDMRKVCLEREEVGVEERSRLSIDLNDAYVPSTPTELEIGLPQVNG